MMMEENKKKSIEAEFTEDMMNYDVLSEDVGHVAEEQYYQAKRQGRKKLIAIILSIVLIECGIGAIMFNMLASKNLHNRVIREFQIRTFGTVTTLNGTYSGDTDFGLFDGVGEFVFDSGAAYKGSWDNNTMEGLGVLNDPANGNYEGPFVSGKRSGQGTYTWKDGAVYEGMWKEDEMCGQGKYVSSDKKEYVGYFDDNKFRDGKCTFKNDNGDYIITFKQYVAKEADIKYADGTKYKGECAQNGISGKGTMHFPNKDTYSGELENDKRNGDGIYKWKTGESYDGGWLNDEMSGEGTYSFTKHTYATGTFEQNCFISGTYHVSNSRGKYDYIIKDGETVSVKMKLKDGTKCSGEMSKGKLNGKAEITYSNGDKYSGDITNNRKSGEGTYEWENGASYKGEWEKDKMDGSGTYFYASKGNGYKLKGEFKEGSPDGKCQYYVKKSEHYKTKWKNGECVKIYE